LGYFHLRTGRLARSTKHFSQVVDDLSELGVQFLSQREALDTDGPLGSAIIVIISAIAELERSLIVERFAAGMTKLLRLFLAKLMKIPVASN
jgi:DNA invertase Pin-like site-specific DNA recombinase